MSWKDLGTDSEFANWEVFEHADFSVREFGVCPQIFPADVKKTLSNPPVLGSRQHPPEPSQQRLKSLRPQQSAQNQAHERSREVSLMTDISSSPLHEEYREQNVGYREDRCGNFERDHEKKHVHSRRHHDRREQDSCYGIAGAERPIIRIHPVSVVDNQRGQEARDDINQQPLHGAQTLLGDGAKGIERHHVKQQVSAIGVRKVGKNHPLIVPACGDVARREKEHAASVAAVHS